MRDWAIAVAKRRGVTSLPSTVALPDHLRRRQRHFSDSQLREITDALKADYFGAQPEIEPVDEYLRTDGGRADLEDHLTGRLERDRATVIPWLDSIKPLSGLRVLEVGAGDGASTVAIAEQGATVLATDVLERSLKVNEARCRIAGLDDVKFAVTNADSLSSVASPGDFDMIVFYAALEHMTFEERLASLNGAWQLLASGGILVVIETPNRLWFFDDHTSMSPFFHWLPDEVAIRYASHTPREYYNTRFIDDEDPVLFSRWGRGVSYHDFELALEIPAAALPVVSSLQEFLDLPRWKGHTRDGHYVHLIKSLAPDVPKGFFYSYLDIALKKP
jgi:S-adenosylmethionine-dependent methyltransferase